MKAVSILALVGLTSVGAYFFGISRLRLSRQNFGAAIGKTLESVGTTLVFLAVNLTVAVTIVLAVRSLTATFVSVYVADDAVWVGLSFHQGLIFQWWRELSRKPA